MNQNFKQIYQQLNPAQKQAVDQIEGPVMVIAGPGTGKTQLLSIRIANILQQTDAQPDNILCLTFTDSAALNMRNRLNSMIGTAAYSVNIFTYHAFGNSIINENLDYFPEAINYQPANQLLLKTIIKNITDQLPYSNPLKNDYFEYDLLDFINDARSSLLTPDDFHKIIDSNNHFINQADKVIQPLSEHLAKVSAKHIDSFRSLLNIPFTDKPLMTTNKIPIKSLSGLWHQELSQAIDHFDLTKKTYLISQWKKQWLEKDRAANFRIAGKRINKKIEAAATIYQLYLDSLKEQKLYDYNDMILNAIEGLKNNDDLRFNLQERFTYILLDEYQDTNEAQSQLVELLTDNPVNENRPNVLAVGDDDQAIFAFQGADYSHMLNFINHYRDTKVVVLEDNYRSTQEILSLSQKIAEQIETRLVNNFPNLTKNLRSMKDIKQESKIERHEFLSDINQNSWIAQTITTLQKENNIPLNEIAVIAPKHKYLEALVPYLKTKNLPIHYEKRENILDNEAISKLIKMCRLIITLNDPTLQTGHLWSEILSYDFFQIPTSTTWEIIDQNRHEHLSWTNCVLSHPGTKTIGQFFIKLSLIAPSLTIEEIFDYLLGTTPLNLYEEGQSSFTLPFLNFYGQDLDIDQAGAQIYWQLLSNLTVLRAQVRSYQRSNKSTMTIYDFMDFIDANIIAKNKIINTSPYQESINALELTTAYQAKGKEYQAVFIIDTLDNVWGNKTRGKHNNIALPANLNFIRYSGATEDERLRLFYVALTRAKTQLFITSHRQDFSGSTNTYLKFLEENINKDNLLISPLLPTNAKIQTHNDINVLPTITELQNNWHQRHDDALFEPKMRDLLQGRLNEYQLSATELNQFINIEYDGPLTFYHKSILHLPTAISVDQIYGNVVHASLEWLYRSYKRNLKIPSKQQTITFFKQQLENKGLLKHQIQLLVDRATLTFNTYLDQKKSDITINSQVEVNFRHEAVFLNQAHLTGKIDKLIIDPANKTIIIVDYKTGTSVTRWEEKTKFHLYKYQLYFYKYLVENSNRYSNYKVIDAYLEFVDPDEDNNICQLHLHFNDEEYNTLKQLIEVVWKHVQELDFPDVSTFPKSFSGIKKFEKELLKNITASSL